MMDSMPCITCQKSLRDNGKITPDWQWAYCTVCGARYEVIPALDEYGQPHKAPNGHNVFYLNPVAPGDQRFYREPEDAPEQVQDKSQKFVDDIDATTDFAKLVDTIRRVETVTQFLKSIKKL